MSGEGPVDCNFELGSFYVEDGGMEVNQADAEDDDGEEDNQEVFVDEDKIDPDYFLELQENWN